MLDAIAGAGKKRSFRARHDRVYCSFRILLLRVDRECRIAALLINTRQRISTNRSSDPVVGFSEIKQKRMSKRIKWGDRTFEFNFPEGLYPEMIERLRGTPARMEELIASLPEETLRRRNGERWSIQENAGHLLDLETLVAQRLDQYLAGAPELLAADMSNRRTYEANHNTVPIASILNSFREQRTRLVNRLDLVPEEMFGRSAFHPRLKKQMRLVDMIYFQAEHDDYHLARISEMLRSS